MSDVQANIPRSLLRLLPRLQSAQSRFMKKAEPLLLKIVRASYRRRSYRTGKLMRSVMTRLKAFKTFGTVEAFTDLYYAKFQERGTKFMRGRYPMRLGLQEAKPAIMKLAMAELDRFAKGQ